MDPHMNCPTLMHGKWPRTREMLATSVGKIADRWVRWVRWDRCMASMLRGLWADDVIISWTLVVVCHAINTIPGPSSNYGTRRTVHSGNLQWRIASVRRLPPLPQSPRSRTSLIAADLRAYLYLICVSCIIFLFCSKCALIQVLSAMDSYTVVAGLRSPLRLGHRRAVWAPHERS